MGSAESIVTQDLPLEALRPGCVIELSGNIKSGTQRFSINLMTSCGDVALHVNPRFDKEHVVYNTYSGGTWQEEEFSKVSTLEQGIDFKAQIHVTEMAYEIELNGKHVADFRHRMLFTEVDKLRLDGDVTLYYVDQRRPPVGHRRAE